MQNNDLTKTICDTVEVILNESMASDEKTRVILILQTKSFFQELLDNIDTDSENLPFVLLNINRLFNAVMESLDLFFTEEQYQNQLAKFISLFVNSKINLFFAKEIAMFMITLFKGNHYGLESFYETIGSFFDNETFPPFFEAIGGVTVLWDLLLDENDNDLCNVIFDHILNTIDFYFQDTTTQIIKDFFSHTSDTIIKLPKCNAIMGFQYIYHLIHANLNLNLFEVFINVNGFKNINNYLIKNNDIQLMSVYQIFKDICITSTSRTIIIMEHLLELFLNPKISHEMKLNAILNIYSTLKQLDDATIQPTILLQMVDKLDDDDSSKVFLDICYYLKIHFNVDFEIIISAIAKLPLYKLSEKIDISILFKLFLAVGDSFIPYAFLFYNNITQGINEEQFGIIANKYMCFLNFLPMVFQEIDQYRLNIFNLFIKSCPFIKDISKFDEILLVILEKNKMVQKLVDIIYEINDDSIFVNSILNSLIHLFHKSYYLRNSMIKMGIVNIIKNINEKNKISPLLIFDIFSSLTNHHFEVNFDATVGSYLKSVQYFNQSEESIRKLSFGQMQNDDEPNSNLCFPSLLHKCGNFEITSFFDMWICGQYGIDNWIKETGKPICDFPSILQVSRRFLLPHHIPLIFEHPLLFSEACNDCFGLIPLFEFLKSDINSAILIQVPFDSNDLSISFWFFFKTFPASSQVICTVHDISIFASCDELYINEHFIFEFSLNRWYNFIITNDSRGKISFFINGKQVLQLKGNLSKTVIFGAQNENCSNWYIGGAIRMFNQIIKDDKIQTILSNGIENTISDEDITITASKYIDLFGDKYSFGKSILSENLRPVLSFPLSTHINSTYEGGKSVFKKILENIANGKKEDACLFLDALINLQKNKLSKWTKSSFAYHISILIGIKTSLFNQNNFDEILKCFSNSNNESFDWDSFLIFIYDYGIFNSDFKNILIPKLFGLIVQYPSIPHKSKLLTFIFDILHICKIEKNEKMALLALLSRLYTNVPLLVRLLLSLPNFNNSLLTSDLKYDEKDSDSLLYDSMIELIQTNITNKFEQNYFFHLIHPQDSLNILFQLISASYKVDEKMIMKICIQNCHLFKSWSCALSLLLNSVINIEESLDFPVSEINNFNNLILPEFLIMTNFLISSAIKMPKDSFWSLLSQKIILILKSISCKLTIMNDELKFALIQLLQFNYHPKTMALFPFAPFTKNISEVVEFSRSQGQQFPNKGELEAIEIPTLHSIEIKTQELNSFITNDLPKTYEIIPHNIKVEEYSEEFLNLIISKNNELSYNSWVQYCNSIISMFGISNEQEIECILKSYIFSDVVSIISSVLLRFVENANLFPNLLNDLLLTNIEFEPLHSKKILNNVLLDFLNKLNEENIYSLITIQFSCKRIQEGWLTDNIVDIISLIFSICEKSNKCLPDCFIELLLSLFDIIPQKDFSLYLDTFEKYKVYIFAKSNIENLNFCVLMLNQLLNHFQGNSTSIKSILNYFINEMKENKEIESKWNKIILSNHPDCLIFLIYEYVTLFVEEKEEPLEKWMKEHMNFVTDFQYLCINESKDAKKETVKNILTSLNNIQEIRKTQFNLINEHYNRFIYKLNQETIISKSIGALIRNFEQKRMLVQENLYLRMREEILTKIYGFDNFSTQVYSLSLLNDPIFPTKRIEKSPLIYKIPSFPSNGVTDIQPDITNIHLWLESSPELFNNLISTPYNPFQVLIPHSKNELKLAFSNILPISDQIRFSLLQLILNKGNPFEFSYNVSLLYGMDPLPGILFKNSTHIFFVEGMKITDNGISLIPITTPKIIYSFYLSYFISGNFGQCFLFESHPIITINISTLIYCCQHYWLHKPVGIELHFIFGWNFIIIPELQFSKTLLNIFKKEADESISHMPKQCDVSSPLNSAYMLRRKDNTKLWVDGNIDNFTYLCMLNKLSLRSLCDYTQYYVFPWIIGDYNTQNLEEAPMESFRNLSLPMGQIGPERANRFNSIYYDSGLQYFYGTHYMHLGVVLYFMFRIDPFCLFSIYLHHGWDHQNRLFYDVTESWLAAAYTSPADVKELIPQFYTLPEFLSNVSNLPLTTTTEGKNVANVVIGRWSKNPRDFTHKMLHFLQCEIVTSHISNWIDLIFGFCSRGQNAVEAKNLFHPLCYVGDDEKGIESEDEIERDAAITCVINFGQCCFQLFKTKHPKISRFYNKSHIMSNPKLVVSQKINNSLFKFPISDIQLMSKTIFSSTDFSLLLPPTYHQTVLINDQKLTIGKTSITNYNFSITSSFCCSKDGVFLVTGRKSGGITLYILKYNSNDVTDIKFVNNFAVDGYISSCAISTTHFLILAVTNDVIKRIDIGTRKVIEPINVGFKINCIEIDDYAGIIIACGYSTIGIWSVSGFFIMEQKVKSSITFISVSNLPETVQNRFFITGHRNGSIMFWTIDYENSKLILLKEEKVLDSSISKISIDITSSRVLVVANEDIIAFDFIGSNIPCLNTQYAAECCNCHERFETVEYKMLNKNFKSCIKCKRFFCQKCVKDTDSISSNLKSNIKFICSKCLSLEQISDKA